MRQIFYLALVFLTSCQPNQKKSIDINDTKEFKIAFGSCNNQRVDNPFWEQIVSQKPDVWIWGGDIIYSDTEDPQVLKDNYNIQKQKPDYKYFTDNVEILGTWDDHDYGVNDGGNENPIKVESQQAFLDFMDVPQHDQRRQQEGVYTSKTFKIGKHAVKIIMLDTRYFRTPLTPDPSGIKRYIPTNDKTATMLGKTQWRWLKKQLKRSKADFNIIMSSIQVLSTEHGFETWGNMPMELEKLEKLITSSHAKNVIIISGDRHISEFSIKNIGSNDFPLMDFTSSGMTHSYHNFSGEDNPLRFGKVISQKSYGMITLDFNSQKATFDMWGENEELLQQHVMRYDQ